jgi:hypothetical protein
MSLKRSSSTDIEERPQKIQKVSKVLPLETLHSMLRSDGSLKRWISVDTSPLLLKKYFEHIQENNKRQLEFTQFVSQMNAHLKQSSLNVASQQLIECTLINLNESLHTSIQLCKLLENKEEKYDLTRLQVKLKTVDESPSIYPLLGCRTDKKPKSLVILDTAFSKFHVGVSMRIVHAEYLKIIDEAIISPCIDTFSGLFGTACDLVELIKQSTYSNIKRLIKSIPKASKEQQIEIRHSLFSELNDGFSNSWYLKQKLAYHFLQSEEGLKHIHLYIDEMRSLNCNYSSIKQTLTFYSTTVNSCRRNGIPIKTLQSIFEQLFINNLHSYCYQMIEKERTDEVCTRSWQERWQHEEYFKENCPIYIGIINKCVLSIDEDRLLFVDQQLKNSGKNDGKIVHRFFEIEPKYMLQMTAYLLFKEEVSVQKKILGIIAQHNLTLMYQLCWNLLTQKLLKENSDGDNILSQLSYDINDIYSFIVNLISFNMATIVYDYLL